MRAAALLKGTELALELLCLLGAERGRGVNQVPGQGWHRLLRQRRCQCQQQTAAKTNEPMQDDQALNRQATRYGHGGHSVSGKEAYFLLKSTTGGVASAASFCTAKLGLDW